MFGKNAKVDLELNRDVEQLIKTGGKEKLLPIVQAGEPVLRQRTVAYNGQLSKRTLAKLIDTMHTTMLEAPGVGLAATQIGLGLALAVVEDHVRDDERNRGIPLPRDHQPELQTHQRQNRLVLRGLPELRRIPSCAQALARHHRRMG